MENLWREAYLVGTEWDQYDKVFQVEWDFSNLEEAFEKGGVLHGKKVYIFGATEPQLIELGEKHKVVHIPAVIAVTSPFPPSDKIGIKSVQMETELIIPMKEMKMDWVPFIPEDQGWTAVERLKKTDIYVLKCVQRRAALRQLKQERVKKYEYCLPYIYDPTKEDEVQADTVVPIMFDLAGDPPPPPLVTEFDWELDELKEFTDTLVENEELPAAEVEKFKEYVRSEVKTAKAKIREAREARKAAIENMSPATKDALANMKFYKFYPKPSEDAPDITKYRSPYINRYYGKAHQLL